MNKAMYLPAWLLATRLPGFWKRRKQKMKTQQLDPARLAADFQDKLVRLIDQAQHGGAKFHALVDVLEGQLTRLRMNDAVSRPW